MPILQISSPVERRADAARRLRTVMALAALVGLAASCAKDGAKSADRAPPPAATPPPAESMAERKGSESSGTAKAEKAPGVVDREEPRTCKAGVLPAFPWPVPKPSARMALPRAILKSAVTRDEAKLKHVANALDALVVEAGYSERAYFRMVTEGQTIGFTLVTRMERIKSDGTPYPPDERFLPAGAPDQFSVVDFLKSLFVAPVGYYRVIVFTVSKAPVDATGPEIGEAGAQKWLSTGGTRLLGCVAEMPFTDDYGLDALIYEFRHAPEERHQDPEEAVSQLRPSQLDPAIHLERAGILSP